MAKTSKPGGKKNKKKPNKSGPDSVAMKVQAPKRDNPFETIWSRRKFDVLGKKRKGEEVKVGQARSRAIDKRKKTLLKEYERSGKSSVFVDKRIGEQDDGLGEFDKAILRSQRERQFKVGKKSKFNLPDDGEDDGFDGLGGLADRDDFKGEMLPDDDDYEAHGNKEGSFARGDSNRRSQPGEDENKHKTKKEVMEEIILKSKKFKAQKAKDKEENEQLMEELDENFTSLVQSRALLTVTEPGKMNALKSLVSKSIPSIQLKKEDFSATPNTGISNLEKPDLYDKMFREMALEIRARPSDRTKTPEEIAQEERERLEALEEERQKRMVAPEDFSDEENDDAENTSPQKPRPVSGDDLGDSFELDEEPKTKKGWVDAILQKRDDDNSESEGASSEGDEDDEYDDDDLARAKDLSMKDWEQSDDENPETDFDQDDEENEEDDDDDSHDDDDDKKDDLRNTLKVKDVQAVKATERRKDSSDARKKRADDKKPVNQSDLPYLIEAPNSFEELSTLFDNRSNSDAILIINRIRASNAIKLAAENRKKMQVFYGLLLQYFAVLASKKPLNIELLDLLVKPLMDMSAETPYFAAICARERISRTRKQFCELIKNPDNSCWPSSKTLSLLRLWSLIFPCSDFRHVVMTPAILLMCEYLLRCPIVSGRDVAVGSFMCSMLLSVAKQSSKFCPEAIMFLRMLLMAAKEPAPNQDTQYYYLMELKELNPLLCLRKQVNKIDPLNFFTLMDMPPDSPFLDSDNFRASVLFTVIENLQGFVNAYESLSSFPEIFSPISFLLLEVANQDNMAGPLQDKLKELAQLIENKVDEHHISRQPLQMRKHKPVPIKMKNPKFDEDYVKGRDYDPDRDRAERKKLKKLLKQESKGAVRELRKDNYFLHEVKSKEKAIMEEERTEKSNKVKAFLEEQQHAFNSGQLGKGRKRRR